MKKIYLLTLTGLMVSGLVAQRTTATYSGSVSSHTIINSSHFNTNRAVGDTLMYIPLPEIFVTDSVDAGLFQFNLNDQDGQAAATAINPPWSTGTNWLLFYEAPPALAPTGFDSLYHADTAFYLASTSWFNPAGCCADDWISFGPVTIPAAGATLGYRVRTPDQLYRDGYNVYVALSGPTPTDFASTDTIFSKNDNTGNIGEDTVWTYRTLNIPIAFAGQQAYFAFQNDANDMFILEMDEFVIKEANLGAGIDNNEFDGFGLNQVMPNPAKEFAYINYSLGKTTDVNIIVTDINGKTISTLYQGTKENGSYNYLLNVSEFNSGVYFVTLKAGQFNATKKIIVAK